MGGVIRRFVDQEHAFEFFGRYEHYEIVGRAVGLGPETAEGFVTCVLFSLEKAQRNAKR
jgi:hypothetical protein